jgi:hypothetical protein
MKSFILKTLSIFAVLGVLHLYPVTAEALSWIFTRIVDTNTRIPGRTENFTCFGQPSLTGKNIAFWGNHRSRDGRELSGIYVHINGTLKVVADKNTPLPEGSGNFSNFSDPSLDERHVAFIGSGSDSQTGIYTDEGGILHMLASKNTPASDRSVNSVAHLGSVSIKNGIIVFHGTDSKNQGGIYSDIGKSLNIIADTNTPVPGMSPSLNFTDVAEASIDSGKIAFTGYGPDNRKGIYIHTGGDLHIIADRNTPVHGRETWNISDLWGPSLDGERIAFKARINDGISRPEAVCTLDGGAITVVAMQGYTAIPDGKGNFILIGDPAMDSGVLAFRGFGDDRQQGIYTNLGGKLTTIVDTNTLLDGKHPRAFMFKKDEAVSGTSVAFSVLFEDNSQAVYRADLVSDHDRLSKKEVLSLK